MHRDEKRRQSAPRANKVADTSPSTRLILHQATVYSNLCRLSASIFHPRCLQICRAQPLFPSAAAVHVAALGLTFGDVTDLVFKFRSAAAPGHVFQVEALIRAQHDHLDGAGLEQRDLVLCSQLPAEKEINRMFKLKKRERKTERKKGRKKDAPSCGTYAGNQCFKVP